VHTYLLLQFLVSFLLLVNLFKKDYAIQGLLEDIKLFVIKGLMLMKIVESIWLQMLTYMPCSWFVYTPKKTFIEKVLLGLVENTMFTYVQLALVDYLLATYNFDLWLS
jgi:hypothetical protein